MGIILWSKVIGGISGHKVEFVLDGVDELSSDDIKVALIYFE